MPLDIVPEVVSPPCTPEAYQLTRVFVVPVTEAVNVCDFPADTVAVAGEIETDTAWLPMVTASEDDAVVPLGDQAVLCYFPDEPANAGHSPSIRRLKYSSV